MMKFSIFNSGKAALVAALLLLGGGLGQASPSPQAKNPRPTAVKRATAKVGKTQKTEKKTVNSFDTPDFAFPETVERNARPEWERALAARDGVKALRSGMQLTAARNLISADNLNANVAMLDSAVKVMPPVYSSLFLLLEADLYRNFYNRNRWTYNRRELPTDTFPEDPRSWSGKLFGEKVYSLVRKATDNIMEARKVPLKDIKSVLSNSETAIAADCSVYDFIIYKAADLLSEFSQSEYGDEEEDNKYYSLGDALTNTLVNFRKNQGNNAALVLAVAERATILPQEKRLQFLREWTDKMIDNPEAARLIVDHYNLWRDTSHEEDSAEGRRIYLQMEEWLRKFPDAAGKDAVNYCLKQLSQPSMRLVFPTQNYPGNEIKGTATLDNAEEGWILIYSVPAESAAENNFNVSKFPGNSRFVKAVPVKTSGDIPYSNTIDITIDPLQAGYYVFVPSAKPTLQTNWKALTDKWSLQPINVSEIAIITSNDSRVKESGRLYVVNALNQQPVKGATVTLYGDRDKEEKRAVTDADGSIPFSAGYSRAKAKYGASYASAYTGFYAYQGDFKASPMCNIFTDLSVYRPGDEVKFLLVEWLSERFSSRLLTDDKVEVVMRDANYNPVDTLSLTTDKTGRASGAFRIPKSGLLGSYTLQVIKGEKNQNIGSVRFEVAEYKTPGFIVNLEKGSSQSYEAGDTVAFTGDVKTFSGMPLGDAKVDYKISWQPWWRWGGGYSNKTFGGTVNTDSDGRFTIKFPTDQLKGTKFEHGIFTLEASATSPSGETQAAPSLRFSLGRDYAVRPTFNDKICVEGDSINLNVPVSDMLGLPVKKTVEYSISRFAGDGNEGEAVGKGSFVSPVLTLPASKLPSGKYTLSFNIEGDTLKTASDLIVYRKSDKKPPYATALWVPETEYYAPDGSRDVKVKVGSGYPDSWLLAVVSGPDGIISCDWVKADDTNVEIAVPTPPAGEKRWLMLSGMRDFGQRTSTVTILPESAKRKLEVKASTFRDKITAGSKEKWRFSFSIGKDGVSDIPAFAVMTDKALNTIAPFKWTFHPGRGYASNISRISNSYYNWCSVSGRFSSLPKYAGFSSFVPLWNFYGNWKGEVVSTVRTTSRAMGTVNVNNVRDEAYDMAEEPQFALAESVVVNSSMKMAAPRVKGAMKEEMAETEDAEEAITGNGGNGAGRDEMQLRPMEMPLAFFLPSLTGDKEGNVEVEFEVPNFNTTWQFQLMGYTKDLLTAGLTLETVASKPVMVQTNAPRFLRTGDKAEITALVFNNTDKPASLDGEITVFNPMTGETIYTYHEGAATVAPAENREVRISFTVPADMNAIGIRTVGGSKEFSDGEQTLVSVLPSSTPVIEAVQFYLGRDRESFSTRLPKYSADANLTLRYCSNPMWECILALPAISTPDSKNVLTLSQALYANATASAIVERHPQIRNSLDILFKEHPDDPSLVSNLEKNADLKAVGLNETPWVNSAASETERLHSLSSLLEAGKAEKAVESILKDMKGLQNKDGGWSWCEGMKSSEFITRQVLSRFAMMARNGGLTSEGAAMAKKGVAYCDKSIYDDYVKSKQRFSTTDLLHYLYIRSSLDNGNGSTGFASLKTKVLKAINNEWKDFSIYDKALAAMLLARSKGYERAAGVILESLRQFAVKDVDKGWNFDNLSSGRAGWNKLSVTSAVLEAFAEIEPKAEAVDGLRQWLVLQKETENWGANPNTVEVIQAILDSGSDWTSTEEAPVITLDGKPLNAGSAEALTGIVTLPLNSKEASGKELRVEKHGEVPMWGGVISQYVAPIREVKAEKCENLKIEKQLLAVTADGKGEKAVNGQLKVGDKVRVTLTVTCDKDMEYVAIIDERPACLQPDNYLSGYSFSDGRGMYREVRDTRTSLFIGFLPKGVNVITYDCHVDRAGVYANGIATVQSQYSPQQVAHSAGGELGVRL